MRKVRQILSLAAVMAIAACTDNTLTNPFNDAAGTYQLTVYAGKSLPNATFTYAAGDPAFPDSRGGTFVVTDGNLVLSQNGTFTETNNFIINVNGGGSSPDNFVSRGTWTLTGTTFSLFDQSRDRQVTGTLAANIDNNFTVNYMEDDGSGVLQAYEYMR